jgi:pimeloyl-ACP methyl ester carboxylesterase
MTMLDITTEGRPNGGVSLTVDVNGPVHVVDHGGDGPPMVLVHGLGGSHLNWVLTAPLLARHFRVISLDLPGFGLTPPEGRSADVSDQADIVAGVISTVLGEPAVIVGNSMGGLIALLTAEAAPDLVAGLVLVDSALPPDQLRRPSSDTIRFLVVPLLPIVGIAVVERRRRRFSVEEAVRRRLEFVTADASRVPREIDEASHEMERARREMSWSIPSFIDAGRSILGTFVNRPRFQRLVHGIGVPTMVIHGEKDEVVPLDHARSVAGERPDWEFEVLEDIGHVPQLECPDELVSLIVDWHDRRITPGR